MTEYMVNSTSVSMTVGWKVNNQTAAPDNVEYLLSYTNKTAHRDPVVWKNTTWTTDTVSCFPLVVSSVSQGGGGIIVSFMSLFSL